MTRLTDMAIPPWSSVDLTKSMMNTDHLLGTFTNDMQTSLDQMSAGEYYKHAKRVSYEEDRPETKTLTIEEWQDLQDDVAMLRALEKAGVEEWSGYSDAIEFYEAN